MPSPALSRPQIVALALLTGVAGVLRFAWLTAEGLWYDEVFSAFVAAHDVPGLLWLAIDDQTNPPAFYLMLWVWTRLGSFGDAWLRTLPAILGTLTPATAAIAGHRAGLSWRAALLGGVIVAGSPLLLAMSVEVRAYAAVALLATAALAVTASIARSPESTAVADDTPSPDALPRNPVAHRSRRSAVAALTLLNVALASLHVFGLVAVLSNTVAGTLAGPLRRDALLKRARPLVLAAIPAVVVLGAWLVLVQTLATDGRFAGNAAWVPAPTARSIGPFVALALADFGSSAFAWLMTAAVLAVVAMGLARACSAKTADAPVARFFMTAALLPPLAVAALYLISGRSLWLPRYLVATVPPLALLIALVISRLRAPWRSGAVAFVVAWVLLGGVHSVHNRLQKPDWASVVRRLSAGEPTTLCVLEGYVGLPLRHYAVQHALPVSVIDMERCTPDQANAWAVYRPEFESVVRRQLPDAVLGPELELTSGLTTTVARRVLWPDT
ncbi:MAG TPA: hypothetical protein VFM71_03195 [Gemmatimonadaceae bacterium]|nr:hypothetical protein [Gemmatimonadaceae bacterium]